VRGIGPATFYPAREKLAFRIGERLLILRRHGIFFVVDAEEQLAVFRRLWINGTDTLPVFGCGCVAIEPQVLGLLCVRTVAGKALVGKNREDLPGKIHGFIGAEKTHGEYEDCKKGPED
jgi:hypothetical protein